MSSFKTAFEKLRVLLFDVDGILTDGGLYIGEDGQVLKRFNIRDGAGLVYAKIAGFKVGLISGHDSKATRARAEKLGLDAIHVGVRDKLVVYKSVMEEFGVTPEETLFMGDDFMDMPVLKRAGFSATVPDAPDEIQDLCDYVTKRAGGAGAVREVIDMILRERGLMDVALREIPK